MTIVPPLHAASSIRRLPEELAPWLLFMAAGSTCGAIETWRGGATLSTAAQAMSGRINEAVWLRASAEEFLLASICGIDFDDVPEQTFGSVTPFSGMDSPPLTAFIGRPAACCAFPLDNPNFDGLPSAARLWLVRAPHLRKADHRLRLDGGASALIPNDCAIFIVMGTTAEDKGGWPVGRSWQLAASLAACALDAAPDVRRALATCWLASGAVNGDAIAKIAVGGKLSIGEQLYGRRWLLPSDNAGDMPTALPTGVRGIRLCHTTADAWAHVTGHGVVDGGDASWPNQVKTLYSFTSGAREPVLLLALLADPGRLILLHSDSKLESEEPAKSIKQILAVLRPSMAVFLKEVSSKNIAAAEKSVKEMVEDNDCAGLFNVTQGNRLMSYAAQSVARLHPDVKLIYRDVDAANFEFTLLDYASFPIATARLMADPPSGINWDVLHSRPPAPREDWHSLQQRISSIPPEK